MINKKHDMSPVEIRIELYKAEVSQAEIARQAEVSAAHVSRVIDGKDSNDRIRYMVSVAIGIDIKRIWPSIYLHGGPRGPGRPRIKSSFIFQKN